MPPKYSADLNIRLQFLWIYYRINLYVYVELLLLFLVKHEFIINKCIILKLPIQKYFIGLNVIVASGG